MKAGWKMVKLGDVAIVGAGNSAPQDDADFSTDGPCFVRTSDVGEVKFGTVNSSNDRLSSNGAKGMRLWKAGTILVPKSGASTFVNHRVILGVDAHVSSHLATIQAEPTRCDARYLLYYLSTVKAQDLIQDQSYPSLKLPEIAGIEIPLPPLAEQKRIVALLDEAFADIDAAKAKAEDLELKSKELRASVLSQLLDPEEANAKAGWRDSSLGEVCDILDYKRRPVTKADRRTGPYPYYGATGVQDYVDQFIYDEPLVLLGEDGAKWKSGDRSAFLVSGKTWVNNHAHVLRPNREIIADEWLVYWLNHSDLTDFITGVTVPKLNQGNMVKIPVPLPPLTEQKRIVALLDEVFEGTAELCSHATNKMSKLSELKASLLTQAFCGELTA